MGDGLDCRVERVGAGEVEADILKVGRPQLDNLGSARVVHICFLWAERQKEKVSLTARAGREVNLSASRRARGRAGGLP